MSDTKRIIRFHKKGLSTKDIAKRVGCSYNTAYSALKRHNAILVKRVYKKRAPKAAQAPSLCDDAIATLKARLKDHEGKAALIRKALKSLEIIGKYV